VSCEWMSYVCASDLSHTYTHTHRHAHTHTHTHTHRHTDTHTVVGHIAVSPLEHQVYPVSPLAYLLHRLAVGHPRCAVPIDLHQLVTHLMAARGCPMSVKKTPHTQTHRMKQHVTVTHAHCRPTPRHPCQSRSTSVH